VTECIHDIGQNILQPPHYTADPGVQMSTRWASLSQNNSTRIIL